MRIQHNILAMNAYRNYNTNTKALAANLEKLSSGYKINRAGDDAAGLAISEKMRAQIKGLEAASKNVKDGTSLVKTAEGAMQEIQDMLGRMKYLATQSSNGTYDNEVDRKALQDEVEQLKSEINRIADSANFNGIKLLDGKMGLNTDAFEVVGSTAAADGTPITDIITTNMPAAKDLGAAGGAAGTDTILHKSGSEAQAGTFTVDLSQLNMVSADGQKGDLTVTIGGVGIDIAAANNGDTMNGKQIATAVKAEFDKLTGFAGLMVDGSGAVAKGTTAATGNKGALLYEVTDNGDGTLTFTATKYSDGTAWKALDKNLPTADVADGACVSTGFGVSVAVKTAANVKTLSGTPNIDGTKTQTPKKPGETQFGNTFLTLDLEKLTDGVEMTIAGETKVIGKDIKIDDLDLTQAADKADLMDRITQAFAGNQHVSVGQDAGTPGKLTLAEKTDGAGKSLASAEMQKKMETLDGFKSLVSFKTASTGVGTELKITDAKVKEGDVLTIDGKSYTFSDKNTGTANGTTYVAIAGGATANLTAALNAAGVSTSTSADGNLVINAKAGETSAPKVLGKGLQLQIGDTSDSYNQMGVLVNDMHTQALGIADLKISTPEAAAEAIQTVMDAINSVSSTRGTLGAIQNRLDHTANNLSVMTENIQDAESTIRDTDVAEEMMAYTKNNILIQSAQAMLAQANAVPQGVLQLLG